MPLVIPSHEPVENIYTLRPSHNGDTTELVTWLNKQLGVAAFSLSST